MWGSGELLLSRALEAAGYRYEVRRRRLTAAAIVVGALAIAFLVWLIFIRDTGSSTKTGGTFEAQTVAGLKSFAASTGHDVYWAGSKSGARYELFKANDGRIYIRYLTGDGVIGDPRPNFVTVGTYPVQNALEALQMQAKQPGNATHPVDGGGQVLTIKSSPQHVYLAFPNSDYQIEVYDPKPNRALTLVRSGKIVPIQ